MKNTNQERLRASARASAKERCRWPRIDGMHIYHRYEDFKPDQLTYWDDVGFMFGKYYISVCWMHPRMVYQDSANDVAYQEVTKLFPERYKEREFRSKPIYRKLGRSRKKAILHEMISGYTDRNYFDTWREIEKREMWYGNKIVRPYIKSIMWNSARGVEICAPMEVRGHADLGKVRDLVIRLLRGETTMDAEFPGYAYSKVNYALEQEKFDQLQIHGCA